MTKNSWRLGAELLLLFSCQCSAQTATVSVTHNDPDGVVAPGQTVEITTTVSWTHTNAVGLGRISGSVGATPNLGVASDPHFPSAYITNPQQTINMGSAVGGSVTGVLVDPAVPYWILFALPIGTPWFFNTGIAFHRFNWTANSEPGVVAFEFASDPTHPDPTFVWSGPGPLFVSFPTTYLGTSLTVIPAPPVAAVAGLGLALSVPRRRRPA